MAQFTIGGNHTNTVGDLPTSGEKAPDFLLTRTDFSPGVGRSPTVFAGFPFLIWPVKWLF